MLGVATAIIGVLHFAWAEPFLRIMPPALPAPLTLVYVSGVFEVLGGLGVLHPLTRRAAAGGLLVLYAMVFPANIHMAIAGIDPVTVLPGTPFGRYVRLPFQLGLFAWCLVLMRQPRRPGEVAVSGIRARDLGVAAVGSVLPWLWITDAAAWLSTAGMSAGIAAAVWSLWLSLDVGVTATEDTFVVRRGPRRTLVKRAEIVWSDVAAGVLMQTPDGPLQLTRAAAETLRAESPPAAVSRVRT